MDPEPVVIPLHKSRPKRMVNFVRRHRVGLTAVASSIATMAWMLGNTNEALENCHEFITEKGLIDEFSTEFIPSKYR